MADVVVGIDRKRQRPAANDELDDLQQVRQTKPANHRRSSAAIWFDHRVKQLEQRLQEREEELDSCRKEKSELQSELLDTKAENTVLKIIKYYSTDQETFVLEAHSQSDGSWEGHRERKCERYSAVRANGKVGRSYYI